MHLPNFSFVKREQISQFVQHDGALFSAENLLNSYLKKIVAVRKKRVQKRTLNGRLKPSVACDSKMGVLSLTTKSKAML